MGANASPPLTVACLKWGRKYGVDYVNILHQAVRRHLTVPHRFVCLTDDPRGIACEILPLPAGLPTWWGKLALFAHPVPGRILYFDLDTVITGGIDDFAGYAGPFCLIKPFYRDWGFASGVMSIGPDFGREVWERFARDPRAAIERCRREADPPWNHGDQRWLELTVPRAHYWQEVLPEQLVSYKVHCGRGLPPGARVVCFHGKPDPHEVADPWVKSHWRLAAQSPDEAASSR
jgi:hypothetical protein